MDDEKCSIHNARDGRGDAEVEFLQATCWEAVVGWGDERARADRNGTSVKQAKVRSRGLYSRPRKCADKKHAFF